MENTPILNAKNKALLVSMSPWGSGRKRVRSIMASIRCSTNWLMAAPEADASPIPKVANSIVSHGGIPWVDNNMPTMAVNTISSTTFGLHSSKYFSQRAMDKTPGGVVSAIELSYMYFSKFVMVVKKMCKVRLALLSQGWMSLRVST